MMKKQIFLLHYAGGSCYSLNPIKQLLKEYDVFSVELPGRGRRLNDALLNNFDEAAQDILDQIKNKLNGSDFMIYGHSLGAYLTLKVAKLLADMNIFPACIVVSGNAGPGVHEPTRIYALEEDPFIEALKKLGGIPNELIENREMLRFFDPIIRADLLMAEQHGLQNEQPLKIPLFAMMGSEEEKVDQIQNWKRFTTSNFKYEILEGDHFFIFKAPQQIAFLIKEFFKESVNSREFANN